MRDSGECGIYIHIPFCKRRCAYCAFVSYPFREDKVEQYVDAVTSEAGLWASDLCSPKINIAELTFDSIYIGGGTPSLLQVSHIEQLLEACAARFSIVWPSEVTIEANPDSCTPEWLKGVYNLGVNRISLGVQSFSNEELTALGRSHDNAAVFRSYYDARAIGFNNVSMDLLAGFPGHTLSSFEKSLKTLIALSPEHTSVYLFELKEGSPIHSRILSGRDPIPDEDLAADLYELCCEFMTSEAYNHYEISNFGKAGFECRHNLKYWMDSDYLGLGAGAHGLLGDFRYSNVTSLDEYSSRISRGQLPFSNMNHMNPLDRFRDALIMGARLVQGVDLSRLDRRYNVDAALFMTETISDLQDQGLFEFRNNLFRFTAKGRLLSNQIFCRWV